MKMQLQLDYALYVMNNVNDFAGETGFAAIPEEEAQSLIETWKHCNKLKI